MKGRLAAEGEANSTHGVNETLEEGEAEAESVSLLDGDERSGPRDDEDRGAWRFYDTVLCVVADSLYGQYTPWTTQSRRLVTVDIKQQTTSLWPYHGPWAWH